MQYEWKKLYSANRAITNRATAATASELSGKAKAQFSPVADYRKRQKLPAARE